MMGLCKDCRYWDYTIKDRKGCNRVDWIEEGEKIKENELAVFADSSDDSGLYCGVITGPLFGCVNFKETK